MKNGCTALVGPTAKGRRCRRKRGEAEQDGPHLALRPERNPGSFEGRQDLQTKVMTTLFALFAEVERVSVSDAPRKVWPRPKLARAARAPNAEHGTSRLDGRDDEVRRLLDLGAYKRAAARRTGVSRTTFCTFRRSRGITVRERTEIPG